MLNKRIDKAWALGICIAVCAAFVSIGIVQADITNPGGSSSGGGGGADGNWVYMNNSGIRLATTTNQVLIGGSATTSSQNLQVQGSAYVSGISGFGTTTPAAKVDINNGVNTNLGLFVEGGASGVNIAQFSRRSGASTDIKVTGSAGNPAFVFGANGADKSAIGYDNANLGFAVAPGTVGTSNFLFVKDTTGNTGIGTSSPYAKLSVVGEAVARNFTATSTTATSTFSGNVLIGTNPAFGFNAGQPLVINTDINGAAQMNLINTNNGAFALAAYFLGNSKTTNLGYSSQYYTGMAMGGAFVNVPGFSELTPDTLALVNSNGMVKIGSNSGVAASSSVAFYTLLGFNTPADMLLNGYGNLGLGTINANARLHVVGTSNATTSLALFDTGTGTATTTRLIIQQNGMVGVGTTTATSTLDVYGSFGGRVTLITSTTTIDSTYYTIRADTTSNAVGVNLPAVSGVCGRHYYIVKKNSGGGPITIDPSGSELIAGTTTQALTTQHGAIHIQAACDDSSWLILN